MSTIEAARARLAALVAARIDWPAGEGIEVTPGVLGGEPRFPGHRIGVAMLRHWEDDAAIRRTFPQLTPEALAAGRAYLAANADLIAGDLYRQACDDGHWPETIAALKADLRALLAEVDRLAAENAGLRHLLIAQIALAQYADQDFDEEVGFAFLAEPAEHTAWHRAFAAELLEERLAALGEEEADHAV